MDGRVFILDYVGPLSRNQDFMVIENCLKESHQF